MLHIATPDTTPLRSKAARKAKADASAVEARVAPAIKAAVAKGAPKARKAKTRASDDTATIAPKAKRVRAPKVAAPVVEAPSSDDLRTRIMTRPDGTIAKLRPTGKRAALVAAWVVDNRLTIDRACEISGWSKAVTSSELFQIAVIMGKKIARNGAGEYQFIID